MKRHHWTILLLLVVGFVSFAGARPVRSEAVKHFGMCDASAAVHVGSGMFVVANDEDNQLRVYRRDTSGGPVPVYSKENLTVPVPAVDLTSFLKLDREHPEADIEGATRVGDRVYWITSHGSNKNGKPRANRRQLFATAVKVSGNKVTIAPIGTPYKNLLEDLTSSPELKDYQLGAAANRPPEQEGGLNIEGLAATPDGTLLIGFRNPTPGGNALLIPLENPMGVVSGKAAELGKPITLALGGRGIRSIEYFEEKGKYLIVAGPHGDEGNFLLYQWSGSRLEAATLVEQVNFTGLHPEALIIYPQEQTKLQVLSDDGSEKVNGKDCKDEEVEPQHKYFRSIWINP